MKNKKKKRPSGSESLKAAGKTAVMVGLTAEQLKSVDCACAIEERSRANFLAHYASVVAQQIVAKENGRK